MRRRAEALGGRLEAGPRAGGGFLVQRGAAGVTRPIRVVVVDDQALVRMGLRTLFDTEPDTELVGEAGRRPGRAGRDPPRPRRTWC